MRLALPRGSLASQANCDGGCWLLALMAGKRARW